MRFVGFALLFVVLLVAKDAGADLIAYWHFNTYDGDATTIAADVGVGTITITGFSAGDLDNFLGTTVNAIPPTPAGTSLSLKNDANNGDFLTVSFSMTGLRDLVLTYATQRSSTGFNSNQWAYSTNNVTFTNFGSPVVPPSSFGLVTLDLSSVSSLNNATTVFLRYTFNGATSSSGNNRIDNVQLNAQAIPEPRASTLLLWGSLALLALGLRRWLCANRTTIPAP
jgi:hypothetical protein